MADDTDFRELGEDLGGGWVAFGRKQPASNGSRDLGGTKPAAAALSPQSSADTDFTERGEDLGGGWVVFGKRSNPQPEVVESDTSWLDELGSAGLAVGTGVTSGIEVIGSLLEMSIAPEMGESIRESGFNATNYLREKMSPEWQQAVEKSFLSLSENSALFDLRSWSAGILSSLPYMIGTAGVGELAAMGFRAAGVGTRAAARQGLTGTAARQAAQQSARGPGYATAGGLAGAGEAASGVAEDADARGLPDEERRSGMRVAAIPGAVGGALAGRAIEGVLAAPGVLRGAMAGLVAEGTEEGTTQLGTELGKYSTPGGKFDALAIAEAFAGGAAIGLGAGGIVNLGARAVGARPNQAAVQDEAEYRAIAQRQIDKIDAEDANAAGSPTAPENTPIAPPVGNDTPDPSLSLLTPEIAANQIGVLNAKRQTLEEKINAATKASEKRKLSREKGKLDAELARWKTQLDQLRAPVSNDTPLLTDQKAAEQVVTNDGTNLPPSVPTTEVPTPQTLPLNSEEAAKVEEQLSELDAPTVAQEPKETTKRVRKGQQARAGAASKAAKTVAPRGAEAVNPPPPVAAPSSPGPGNAEAAAIAETMRPSNNIPAEVPEQPSPPAAGASPAVSGEPVAQAGQSVAAPPPAPTGPGTTGDPPTTTVPGPTGPVDTRVPRTRKQKGVRSAPNTLSLEEHAQQQQAKDNEKAPPSAKSQEPLLSPLPSTKPKKAKTVAKMTPDERLRFVLRDGKADIDTVLAALQDAYGKNRDLPIYRLIEKLRKAFPNSKKNPITLQIENRKLDDGMQGVYDPKKDRIYVDLDQAEDTVVATLHEAVHAAIITRVRSDPKEMERWARMVHDAQVAWFNKGNTPNFDELPAFNSVEEFIATALTNSDMADQFDAIQVNDGIASPTVLTKIKARIKDLLGVRSDPPATRFLDVLLEYIPDGTLIQDGNRTEVLAKLNELGLAHPSALFSTVMRSALRSNLAARALPNTGFVRPRKLLLPLMTTEQIARSFGYLTESRPGIALSNAINQFYALVSQKDGYANKLRAQASRTMEAYKNLTAKMGSKYIDDLLVDSRLWSIHADLAGANPAAPHAKNVYGYNLPGGAQNHAELAARWNSPIMTPEAKAVYSLVRDNATAERSEYVNQIILQRLRSLLNRNAADAFERYIYQNIPGRYNTATHAGVTVEWYSIPTATEISNFMAAYAATPSNGVSLLKQQDVAQQLVYASTELGQEQGPYVPLRRFGEYYTVIESAKTKVTMTKAQLDAFANRWRDKDLNILSANPIKNRAGVITGYRVEYQFKYVTAHDTERQSEKDRDEQVAKWSDWGITPASTKAALSRDASYDILGLTNSSVQALIKDITKGMAPSQAEAVKDLIVKYYLEKLPDTSVRKSQLKAKKISGASRDMLHVLSNHAMGAGYMAAQLRYGHRIARTLETDMKNDVVELQKAGKGREANDITMIQNHLIEADKRANDVATQDFLGRGYVGRFWNSLPQMAGAWVLTGPGTAITNSFQPIVMTYPHLAAIHGDLPTASAMLGAMRDVTGHAVVETLKEGGRFIRNTGASVKGLTSNRGLLLRSFRDPSTPFFNYITRNLDAEQRWLINELADYKKIDFGITADIQSLAKKRGKLGQIVDYVTDAAFILPQAVETTNRTVTALASYRLNKDKVYADPRFTTPEQRRAELARLAAQDIDRTQWNYSAVNKPLLFQNQLLRPFATFKTYAQAMFYTIMRNMLESFRGKTAEERRVARRTIAGIGLATFAVSGMMGLFAFDPIYLTLLALVGMFADEGEDPESVLREAMQEVVSQGWADALLKGGFYGAGVADTSRMGLPQLLPYQDIFKASQGQSEAPDIAKMVGITLLGAPGSIAEQVWNGVAKMTEGDYLAGLSLAAPKAFGANDFLRAVNMQWGVEDSRGLSFVDAENISLADQITRALGFEPPEISRAKQNRNSYYSRDRAMRDGKQAIIDAYVKAVEEADRAKLNELYNKTKEWNRKYPGYAITGKTVNSSIRNRMRGQANTSAFGVNARTPGQRMLAMEIERENPTDF